MAVVPEQAEVVKEIFRLALSGLGAYRIAQALNEKQIPPMKGTFWSDSSVNAILKNEKYAGDTIFQKTYTDDRFKRHKNYGEKNRYLIQNHHKAIIDRKTFKTVDDLIERRRKEKGMESGKDNFPKRTVLSGKVRCGICGSVMKRLTRYSQNGSYKMLGCGKHLSGAGNCPMKSIYEEALKSAFASMMNKLSFAGTEMLDPVIQDFKNRIPETHSMEDEINALSEKLDKLTSLHASGYLDAAHFLEEKKQIHRQNQPAERKTGTA